MKFKLIQSYNLDKKKFLIYKDLIQKPNFSFKLYKRRKVIKLLYPSNHYEYKNHGLLIELFKNYKIKNIEIYCNCNKKRISKI